MNNKNEFDGAANRTRRSSKSNGSILKLLVHGLDGVERRLLEAAVKLSQRRTPSLELVTDAEAGQADVVMVDARDPQASQWARNQSDLDKRVVLWVDGQEVQLGHMAVPRPVQWSILPMLIARAMDQNASPTGKGKASDARKSGANSQSQAWERVGAKILIVDDSLAMRAHLRTMLEARSYEVLEARNAAEALDIATSGEPACVLLDVMMPGTDGYECCRDIKNRMSGRNGMPVVMLTSKSSPFDRIRGKMAGCDAYLTKPVEAEQLHAVLARHVRITNEETLTTG